MDPRLTKSTSCLICSNNRGRNIPRINENTRLLREPAVSSYTKLWTGSLLILLILGCSVGFYLILNEDREWREEDELILISRSSWKALPTNNNLTKMNLPSQHVLLYHLSGNDCLNELECVAEVLSLQKNYLIYNGTDIPFNFLLGGDGKTYEGRGWNFLSGFTDGNNSTLSVAYLGTFLGDVFDKQTSQLRVLLKFGVMKGKLLPCFNINVRDKDNMYLYDVAKNLQKTSNDYNRCRNN